MNCPKPEPPRIPLLLHPFLLAVYPALFLYSHNMSQTSPVDLLKPIAISLALTLVLLLAANALLRNLWKACLIVSFALIAIFSYGHVIELMRNLLLGGLVIARGWVMVPAWGVLFVVFSVIVIRTRRSLITANRFATVLAAVLVAAALVQCIGFWISPASNVDAQWQRYSRRWAAEHPLDPPKGKPLPDIYYIILDEYARADFLKDRFGFDNTPFLDELRSKGFYVAEKSRCNYLSTYLSLSSSLNFDYLSNLSKEAGVDRLSFSLFGSMIQNARLAHMLKNAGYKFVFFPSGFHVTNRSPIADVTVTRSRITMTEFDRVLFDTTIFKPVVNLGSGNYAKNIIYAFDNLGKVADDPKPTFTFAHITTPHVPYLFNADGSMRDVPKVQPAALTMDEYRKLYIGQVVNANTRTLRVVDEILAKSKEPPIIIIQGDHGFVRQIKGRGQLPAHERCLNLSLYHLPDGGEKQLYPSITPVNTFRVVINHYLGGDYDLLDDRVYVELEEGSRTPRLRRLKLP